MTSHWSITAARVLIVVTLMAVIGPISGASAQAYPDRRITFVVPYPAGGATDVAARLLATKLADAWKQSVVVENKSGGGGIVGNDFVAKAPADGYTVLVAITQIIQAPSLFASLPYDVFRDLAPVTHVAQSPIILTIPDAQPMKSFQDLIAAAKANPGKLPYGTFGNATTSHLYGELLKKTAGIDMIHVPYRGSAPLMNDLLGNQVTAAFLDFTTAGPQLSAGKVRALAVGGESRKAKLPDVPTLAELGYPGFEAEGWIGVFVPAATPKEIVTKLSSELARIIASPEGVTGLQALNLVPVGGTAETFAATLRRDQARWATVAQTAGVKGE
ncbi:tripartite tricarboxylate transporter substrate binding protein [Bradyrhizobium prioriisuperbiae]|uniref:Bug family tripartite tricarboxylate transporter substrate binding protein n=1 Tax=Bradyrhizobium prioriisuperbiae TaxID=2854389 RepID=UPI0028E632B8|nr:tripartite tricarboxylate transporter substrate binding protein [Bradyrhizobium prioritasuperba]